MAEQDALLGAMQAQWLAREAERDERERALLRELEQAEAEAARLRSHASSPLRSPLALASMRGAGTPTAGDSSASGAWDAALAAI